MRRSLPALALAAAATVAIPTLSAYVRITWHGRSISWNARSPDPPPVAFTIQRAGSDDVHDGSDETAIRLAFQTWENAPGANIAFSEDRGSNRDRRDWDSPAVHLVLFDEDNSSGWFPGSSGTVALTPITFSLEPDPISGDLPILDADILFNGDDHRFSTDQTPGTFDIQAVATHEIGHFLGLDHSGCGGASLFPYVSYTQISQRSLSADDLAGVRSTYPLAAASAAYGTLSGMVRHLGGTPISGAQIVALDSAGRARASALSNGLGLFAIQGLDPGSYSLYAAPLNGPVTGANFSSTIAVQSDFSMSWLGAGPGQVYVAGGQVLDVGEIRARPPFGLRISGVSGPIPLVVRRGASGFLIVLSGDGLESGSTLRVAGDGISYDRETLAFGVSASRTISVSPNATLGLRDVIVTDPSGREAVCSALIEILDPPPVLGSLTPVCGPPEGGTEITVHGEGFTPGMNLLWDGVPLAHAFVDSTTLRAITPARAAGFAGAVLIRPDGEEARLAGAFLYGESPAITTVFPAAGSAVGGTAVTLVGGPFEPRATVLLDGQSVPHTTVLSTSELRFQSPPHAPATVALEVLNPASGIRTAAVGFAYVAAADPSIGSLSPAAGSSGGADLVQLAGSNLRPGARVFFGADPRTGLGGVEASGQSSISPSQLEVLTPAHASGEQAVLVLLPSGQAAVLDRAFTFGTAARSGETIIGEIEEPGARDLLVVDLLGGSRLDIDLRAYARSSLLPEMLIELPGSGVGIATDPGEPAHDPAFARGSGSRRVRISKWIAPSTGSYWIRTYGGGASSGGYRLRIRARVPRAARLLKIPRSRGLAMDPTRPARLTFEALPGSALRGMLKVAQRGTLGLRIEAFEGPAGSLLSDPRVAETISISADGSQVRLRSTPLDSFGSYTLLVAPASGGSGALAGALKIKEPRSRRTRSE